MVNQRLKGIFNTAHTIEMTSKSKFVIFSDLHMGNGKRADDFKHNGVFFRFVLENYYLTAGYQIILNGDIEELQKFSLPSIRKQWGELSTLFANLQKKGILLRTEGNHDMLLSLFPHEPFQHKAIHLKNSKGSLYVLHGHQADNFITRYNKLISYILKFFAKTFGIKNISSRMESQRKYKIEKAIYRFSNKNKVISIIGHTHRPLFESLSKVDTLRFKIEKLLRDYAKINKDDKPAMKEKILEYKKELEKIYKKKDKESFKSSLYNEAIPVPSLFNTGYCIGKKGFTCIEINNETISLCFWRDKNNKYNKKKFRKKKINNLEGTDYEKVTLKSDSLEYIFDCLNLLT